MPERIQRRRTKGWRMPAGAIYVGRPTGYGNPFRAYKCTCCGCWDVIDENGVTYIVDHEYARSNRAAWVSCREATAEAVRLYHDELTYWLGGRMRLDVGFRASVEALRGHDLACWCPLEDAAGNRFPCHADVLLELANSEVKSHA